jgi:hypothetical protein
MSYTLDTALILGSQKAGLTLAAQLVDTAGADVGDEVTTGFTEIGNGNYLWHYAAFPDGHRGGVKFYESGTPGVILAFAGINPEENEIADALLDRADGIETGVTPKQALQRMAAVLAGKASGAGTGTEEFIGLDGATVRVEVTTTAAGNRTAVSYDPA